MNPTGFMQNKYQEFMVEFVELPTGTSISMQYKINHGNWTNVASVKDVKRHIYKAVAGVTGGDLELKITINSSGNDSPITKRAFVGVI
jgi:hypothetical protein